jgi:hypothetical protein
VLKLFCPEGVDPNAESAPFKSPEARADIGGVISRAVVVVASFLAALATALPVSAATPPPLVVAKVGVEVAKLGLATNAIDTATSKCASKACLDRSYRVYYAEAAVLDNALKALWSAAGRSGRCASAAVNAAAGFDSVTGDYRALQRATLAHDQAAATKAAGRIRTKVARVSAIVGSFKVVCR